MYNYPKMPCQTKYILRTLLAYCPPVCVSLILFIFSEYLQNLKASGKTSRILLMRKPGYKKLGELLWMLLTDEKKKSETMAERVCSISG